MNRLHPSPSYPSIFHGPARLQMARLHDLCATPEGEAHVTGWLLLNPATVDALCIASGLNAAGQVSAGVRALVRLAKESR